MSFLPPTLPDCTHTLANQIKAYVDTNRPRRNALQARVYASLLFYERQYTFQTQQAVLSRQTRSGKAKAGSYTQPEPSTQLYEPYPSIWLTHNSEYQATARHFTNNINAASRGIQPHSPQHLKLKGWNPNLTTTIQEGTSQREQTQIEGSHAQSVTQAAQATASYEEQPTQSTSSIHHEDRPATHVGAPEASTKLTSLQERALPTVENDSAQPEPLTLSKSNNPLFRLIPAQLTTPARRARSANFFSTQEPESSWEAEPTPILDDSLHQPILEKQAHSSKDTTHVTNPQRHTNARSSDETTHEAAP